MHQLPPPLVRPTCTPDNANLLPWVDVQRNVAQRSTLAESISNAHVLEHDVASWHDGVGLRWCAAEKALTLAFGCWHTQSVAAFFDRQIGVLLLALH